MADSNRTPRCLALVGPYGSGKTSLMESILHAAGANPRRGTVTDGTSVGDSSPEARARHMSTEPTLANFTYLGDPWTLIDCPGSVEFAADTHNALMVADAAVIVVEPEADRALMLGPLFRMLEDHSIPHMMFVNKVDTTRDTTGGRIRELMTALQGFSRRPLVLRQVPIRDGEAVTGYVDVVSERAYKYHPGEASDRIPLPEAMQDREQTARQELLEAVADFDDLLMEQLIEDVLPATETVYQDLAADLQQDLIVPVFLGAGLRDHGVRRLLKAMRHEVPACGGAALRLGLDDSDSLALQVFRTVHQAHAGKLSLARLFGGTVKDGATLGDARVSGLVTLQGGQTEKITAAGPGAVVGLGRMDSVATGRQFIADGWRDAPDWPTAPKPVYRLAIKPERREDEVKVSTAVARLMEDDPGLSMDHRPETGEMVLGGQGDIHLQVTVDRLRGRYNVNVEGSTPKVPYRETIRKPAEHHARFKRQSGGHGQFADIRIEIAPLPRGEGFVFGDRIVGGAVPKNYIPAVEAGVADWMSQGPLGFPVVDLAVTLVDGQFHSVDSSDMAFKTVARQAMTEAVPTCTPVLLEPIHKVAITAPSEFTARVQRLVSGRRGQLLGFDSHDSLPGWDVVSALMPLADLQDLILELRSATQGIGTYEDDFDHLQELTGRLADQVVARAAE